MNSIIVSLSLAIFTSACSNKSNIKDPNLEIVIEDGDSYKYNLSELTYSVHKMSGSDTTIHFRLSNSEKTQIINKYYDLELNSITGKILIKDECMDMPKIYTTLKVKSKLSFQEIQVDEYCSDFKIYDIRKGNKVKAFLRFTETILKNKKEIKAAPKSDIFYE